MYIFRFHLSLLVQYLSLVKLRMNFDLCCFHLRLLVEYVILELLFLLWMMMMMMMMMTT